VVWCLVRSTAVEDPVRISPRTFFVFIAIAINYYKLLVFFHMHVLLFILPFIPLLYLLLLTLLHVRLFRVFSTNSQICRLGDGLRMVGLRQLAALFQWRPSRLLPFPSFPLLLPLSFPSLPLPSFPL